MRRNQETNQSLRDLTPRAQTVPKRSGSADHSSKIVFFDFFHTFGGAQRSTATLINWLREHDSRQYIFLSPSAPHPKFAEMLVAPLIVIYDRTKTELNHARASKLRFSASFVALLFNMRSLLRRIEIRESVFITSSQKGLITLGILKILFRVPIKIIFYARGEVSLGSLPAISRMLLRRSTTRILAVSRKTKDNLIKSGLPEAKLRVVYTSVDTTVFLNRDCPPPSTVKRLVRVLFVGSLIPTKGLHHIVGALCHLRDRCRFQLQIAGDTPNRTHDAYAQSVREQAATLGEGAVQWLGWVKDVTELVCSTDIVCLPSYTEGFPRIVVEAMAAGRIVLASPVGGIPELIDDGVTGRIIPLDDFRIGTILEGLLDDKEASQLGANARNMILDRYSLDKQGRMVLDALKN